MNQESKTLVVMTGLNLLAVICWVFVLMMLLDKSEIIANKSQQLNQLALNQSTLITSRSIINETQYSRDLLSQYFYNEATAIDLIENIEILGERASVQVDFSNVNTDKNLVLELQAIGNYSQVINFLKLLENGPFVVDFNQTSLSKSSVGGTAGSGGWVVDISLQVLSFNQ